MHFFDFSMSHYSPADAASYQITEIGPIWLSWRIKSLALRQEFWAITELKRRQPGLDFK